jgi:hypothetical protein
MRSFSFNQIHAEYTQKKDMQQRQHHSNFRSTCFFLPSFPFILIHSIGLY